MVLVDDYLYNKFIFPVSDRYLGFIVFQHIFCQMDASLKLRSLEDVPGYFKALGYPFIITRSSMHAVGTLHTWPKLLAALVWLVDLLKVSPLTHIVL